MFTIQYRASRDTAATTLREATTGNDAMRWAHEYAKSYPNVTVVSPEGKTVAVN